MSTIPSSPTVIQSEVETSQLHPPGGGGGRGRGGPSGPRRAFASSPLPPLVWCSFPLISHDPPGVGRGDGEDIQAGCVDPEVVRRTAAFLSITSERSLHRSALLMGSWKRKNLALEHLHLLLQPAWTCPITTFSCWYSLNRSRNSRKTAPIHFLSSRLCKIC